MPPNIYMHGVFAARFAFTFTVCAVCECVCASKRMHIGSPFTTTTHNGRRSTACVAQCCLRMRTSSRLGALLDFLACVCARVLGGARRPSARAERGRGNGSNGCAGRALVIKSESESSFSIACVSARTMQCTDCRWLSSSLRACASRSTRLTFGYSNNHNTPRRIRNGTHTQTHRTCKCPHTCVTTTKTATATIEAHNRITARTRPRKLIRHWTCALRAECTQMYVVVVVVDQHVRAVA